MGVDRLAIQLHVHLVEVPAPLPPRQRQVLELVAVGHSSKQIAYKLGLSEKTIKMHRALLLPKLGASRRFGAGNQKLR